MKRNLRLPTKSINAILSQQNIFDQNNTYNTVFILYAKLYLSIILLVILITLITQKILVVNH